MNYYLPHLATYLPMLGALFNVPTSEALLFDFVGARLQDINKVCHLWADFKKDVEKKAALSSKFGSRFELCDAFPVLPAQGGDKPYSLDLVGGGTYRFERDRFFARQRLLGMNPVVIQRVNPDASGLKGMKEGTLNGKTNYSDAQFVAAAATQQLTAPVTFAAAIATGRVYVADYSVLANVQTGNWRVAPKYLVPCVGLFYSDAAAGVGFQPIGIQLGNTPGAPIVLPGHADWDTAKATLNAADAFHHEIRTHLTRAHYVTLDMVRRARSELHSSHPVRIFLEPHFHAVVLNMAVGARLLTNPHGMVEEILPASKPGFDALADDAWDTWSFAQLNPHTEIAERGCDDPTTLPIYPYRDCALPLWDAIHTYASAVMNHVYFQTPLDTEVLAWRASIEGKFTASQRQGFSLLDVAGLVNLVAGLVFVSGPFHAAVNYAQWDHSIVPPAFPASLYADPKTSPAFTDLAPGYAMYIRQVEVLCLLSMRKFAKLADVPVVAGTAAHHQAYLTELAMIEQQIPAHWAQSYPYLFPSKVPAAANV